LLVLRLLLVLRRRRRLLLVARRRLPGVVPRVLRVDQAFQLAPVEEDAAALAALVHGDAAALVVAHLAVAFRARHLHTVNGNRRACPDVRRTLRPVPNPAQPFGGHATPFGAPSLFIRTN
jgi:hypothetical protein